jgi:signal transduction histidine kinase
VSPSLRVRLTALYGGVFAVFVAVLMAASYWLMRGHLDRTLEPAEADSALSQLATQYIVAFAGATLLATALGWALAGRELRSMADAFARQQRFVANASHELRSPLTVARTEVEVALADPGADAGELRAMGEDVLETVDRMDELLDGLMLLAQSGRPPERAAVDLAGIARAAAARVRPDGGVRVRLELDPVQVRGEQRLLERLAENLVENGVRYNAPGGFVEVRTGTREKTAVLRVENSGPLVPAATAERLLEPFERGGRARDGGGAGLGLSIVRAVAEAHGGHIALTPRSEGGLAVEVVLPAGQTRGSAARSPGQSQRS